MTQRTEDVLTGACFLVAVAVLVWLIYGEGGA